MSKFYLALCASLFSLALNAQIVREKTTPQNISNIVPGFSQVSTTNTITVSYTPPTAPSQPTPIDEDTTTEGNGIYEFGSVLPVSFSLADGNITSTSVGKVWTLRISVPNALSVGVVFTQFNLSPTAELYVYNDAKTAVDRGIKKEHFTFSDTIAIGSMNGNAVTLYIIEPGNFGAFQSGLTVGQLVAGFQNISDIGDIDVANQRGSINCIPHVQCYPWHLLSARSVARVQILRNNGRVGQCTGTLINNEQNNGRAYLLMALHCIDKGGSPLGFPNGIIDPDEMQELRTARFQFQFWRTQCNGSTNNQFLQFNGAVPRSVNHASDMVLLELINQPGIGDGVNYAGWNRQTNPSSNSQSYIIHHPNGEDMRHTQSRTVRNYSLNGNYWQAFYSSGVVAPGSSGSALFNEYSQIIGQLKGGWSSCSFTDFSDRYGKFHVSYTQGGLQQWLSPSQNSTSTPTLVLSPIAIQGYACLRHY